jgi:hypothetical protein
VCATEDRLLRHRSRFVAPRQRCFEFVTQIIKDVPAAHHYMAITSPEPRMQLRRYKLIHEARLICSHSNVANYRHFQLAAMTM